jgi:hypothetical protein
MIKIINLTPHDVYLINEDNNTSVAFRPSGIIPRCNEIVCPHSLLHINHDGEAITVEIVNKCMGDITNLPEPCNNTYYIVSLAIAQKLKGLREDLIVPNSMIKNKKGVILGCRNFTKI